MQIFLGILLVLFLIFAIGAAVVVMKIRSVVKQKGAPLIARGRVFGLETALAVIKERAAKPENAGNAEIADLQQRVETALAQARSAYEASDYAKVAQICDPLLEELAKHAERIAEEERLKRETEAARQAANTDGNVIDGEFTEVKEPTALLPAPNATTGDAAANATTGTDKAADTAGANANAPAATDTNGTEGDGTKKS